MGSTGGEETDTGHRPRRSIVDIPSSESEVGDLGGDVGDDSSVLDSSSDSNLEHSVPSVGPGGGYTADEIPMELDGAHTTTSVSNTHVNVGQVDAVGMHTSAVGVETPSLRCSVHTKSWQPGCTVCDQALLLSSKVTAVDPRKMAVADRLLGRKSTKPAHAVELGLVGLEVARHVCHQPSNKTIAIPEDKILRLVTWIRSLLAAKETTQSDLESLMGTMVSVVPACPLAPMHYRSLQRALMKSLRSGRRSSAKVSLSTVHVRSDLLWWAKHSGFRGNSSTSWTPPSSDVSVWTDASPWGGGAVNTHGDYFQRSWSETESCQHINLLEIRAAREGIRALVDPHETVRPHIDNTTACAYIRKIGGTRSVSLCQESLKLWREVVSRDVHVLSPFWLSSADNLEADFLSHQRLLAWDFQLRRREFRRICCQFQVKPTLDAFATSRTNQLSRYMTWERDESAVGQNCLDYYWDPVTWLFPPVPLIPAVLREVEEQQIEAILICPGWKRALWWPHLSKMLVQPIRRLPAARLCLSYPESTTPVEFSMDPLVAAHISGSL